MNAVLLQSPFPSTMKAQGKSCLFLLGCFLPTWENSPIPGEQNIKLLQVFLRGPGSFIHGHILQTLPSVLIITYNSMHQLTGTYEWMVGTQYFSTREKGPEEEKMGLVLKILLNIRFWTHLKSNLVFKICTTNSISELTGKSSIPSLCQIYSIC